MVGQGWGRLGLGLGGEEGLVGLGEGFDLILRCEQPFPLASVQGDREAAKAVDGQCALVRDFHREALGRGRAECGVLALELGDHGEEFGLGGLCGHGIGSVGWRGIGATIANIRPSRSIASNEFVIAAIATRNAFVMLSSSQRAMGMPRPRLGGAI